MTLLRTYAGYILFVELLLAAVLLVGLVVPLPGAVEFKIVQSGSMEPAIPVGALIAVVPTATYAVGDVITFGYDGRARIPTTHRITDVTRDEGRVQYVTKGDANEEADNEPVPHPAVIGHVAVSVPRLGYVLDFARSREGFFLMAVVPAALIVLDEVLNIIKVLHGRRTRTTPVSPRTAVVSAARINHVHETSHNVRTTRSPTPYHPSPLDIRAGIDGCRIVARPA